MINVRELLREREDGETSEGASSSNWIGRCLEDRYEIGELLSETEFLAIHGAKLDDSDSHLIASIYKGLQLSEDELSVLHSDLAALREAGLTPAAGMIQADDAFVVFEARPEGRPLSMYLAEHGPLDPTKALSISGQLLSSLSSLHDIDQTILSLSPNTVWIDDSGAVALATPTRLGQRSLLGLEAAKSRAEGTCFAFASYLMPEAVSGRELTSAADIYGVGLVLYEMLAGRPAFTGDDFKKVARKHALERPLNPRIVNRQAKLSSELDRGIMKALEKTVKRRHESAMAFFEALRETKEGAVAWSMGGASSEAVEGSVLETQAMRSLESSTSEDTSMGSSSDANAEEPIGLASTQDSMPESEPNRSQTQPLSSSLTRAVVDGMLQEAEAEGGAESSDVPLAEDGQPAQTDGEGEPSHQGTPSASLEDDDWYADSPEQYASKTAHYDPYELEGVSRDSNLLAKILGGVALIAVVLSIFIANSGDDELDTDSVSASSEENATTTSGSTNVATQDAQRSNVIARNRNDDSSTQKAEKSDSQDKASDQRVVGQGEESQGNASSNAAKVDENLAAEKAAAEKAAAEKAAAEKAKADKAKADKAKADKKAAAAKAAAKSKRASAAKKKTTKAPAKRKKLVSAGKTSAKAIVPKAKISDNAATARAEEKQRKEREAAKKKKAERAAKVKIASAALKTGNKLLKQGDHSKAKAEFKKAIGAKGLSGSALATAHAGLGSVEYELGNFSGSVREYKRSLARVSGNAERWYLLSRSYFRLGNKKDAKSAAEKALKIKPSHAAAKRILKRVSE